MIITPIQSQQSGSGESFFEKLFKAMNRPLSGRTDLAPPSNPWSSAGVAPRPTLTPGQAPTNPWAGAEATPPRPTKPAVAPAPIAIDPRVAIDADYVDPMALGRPATPGAPSPAPAQKPNYFRQYGLSELGVNPLDVNAIRDYNMSRIYGDEWRTDYPGLVRQEQYQLDPATQNRFMDLVNRYVYGNDPVAIDADYVDPYFFGY